MDSRDKSVFLLLLTMVAPILSSEYCPAEPKFKLDWPMVAIGKSVTKDCSKINSSWTGKFTAKCARTGSGNSSWQYGEGCGCEIQTVLPYYATKVSSVNEANFLEVVVKLENAFTNFTNQKVYENLLSTLRDSMCKQKTPLLKSVEWDKIQRYCQRVSNDTVKHNHYLHFKDHFCQKVGSTRSTDLDPGLVLPSFGESGPKPNSGEAFVDLGNSSSKNVTETVNKTLEKITSSGCTVQSYRVINGTLSVKAKVNSTVKEKRTKIREMIELVLIGASLVAIICSQMILTYTSMKSSQTSEKLFVHINLLLSWGIGYAVYIVDATAFDTRNERTATCTAVAVTRHFFQTAVFTWMLVEAVNLFIKIVKVLSTKRFYITYLVIGWGIPALIVGITAAVRTETYNMSEPITQEFMCGLIKFTAKTNRTSCWLNGSKWLYTGPVFAILLVNLFIFVLLLKIVFGKVATRYNNNQLLKTRKGLKSVAALLPLLGVTWLFGLFIDLHEVLAYIFIVLTSTQGIVFCIFHCILDDQVRLSLNPTFKMSFLNKYILPGKVRNEYTVNRTPGVELVKKQRPNETINTFKEIT